MTGLSFAPPLPKNLSCFLEALEYFSQQLIEESSVVVAFSGGLDSTVLLHLLSQSAQFNGRLSACYIDHGLQPELSKEWALHCEAICNALSVPYQSKKVTITSTKRKGVESVARTLRYQALTEGLSEQKAVLVTGHHQRDQAETLILNLTRGAGVSGLAAMPVSKMIDTDAGLVRHLRPLLAIPHSQFIEYAEHFSLSWVEDPSNQSERFKRNIVRHQVLPVLAEHWPNIERTLSRTAQNMSEAQFLLDKMAQDTLGLQAGFRHYLDLSLLAALDWRELKNCIRYWLSDQFLLVLSVTHYEWIHSVILCGGVSKQGRFSYQLGQGELRFYRHRLYYQLKQPVVYSIGLLDALRLLNRFENDILIDQVQACDDSVLSLPVWCFSQMIDPTSLHRFNIRSIHYTDDIDRKKLKSFFQQGGVPTWERAVWPVLEMDGQMVSVLGCAACLNDGSSGKGLMATDENRYVLSLSLLDVYELMQLT